jgi:hypothetical protein
MMPPSTDAAERRKAMTRLEELATVMLQDGHHDEQSVLQELEMFRSRFAILDDDDVVQIARRLGERLNIDVDRGSVITAQDYKPWLGERKRDYEWARWQAYRTLLLQQKRSPKVIDKLDDLADEILDLVGDPSVEGSWARRGLVLGDVQSGKTGTYLALFNKAADVGYRLVILLAGSTEVLRQQTQARVDEAFIGRDSSRQILRKGTDVTPSKLIGIGNIRKDLAHATGLTTVLRDFRKSSHEATNITIPDDAPHPFVFVLKKNKSILNAVTQWLEEQSSASGGSLRIPVLVLDDESDYASINTKDETDPTAINKAIRDILGLFSRSSYVAFTATPFANIFVDHGVENDLFPRDFVYSLEAPSNYVGAAQVFGSADSAKSDVLVILDDVEDLIPVRHKSQLEVPTLPSSLLDAVRVFMVGNAVRDLRDQTDSARSMLVNVSRFKHVQGQVFDLLQTEVSAITNAVQLHANASGTSSTEIAKLKAAFTTHYEQLDFTWEEVVATLAASTSDIRVNLFNSDKDRQLAQSEDQAWDRPPRMIAVGGDVLSRGLTLDGLMVSYFHRAVTASDTLMQMARWFGYRDGYADLCRVWINQESADNYRLAADSIAELRIDLRLMLRQQLTPADFGLAVKKHPNSLLITARNKMRNAQSVARVVSLAGRRLETTRLDISQTLDAPSRNRHALGNFLKRLDGHTADKTSNGWHRWVSVDRSEIADFLDSYVASPSDAIFSNSHLSKWARRTNVRSFQTWDVVLAQGRSSSPVRAFGPVTIHLPERRLVRDGDQLKVSGSRLRLAGATDLAMLLPETERAYIDAEFKAAVPESTTTPETRYYKSLARPVLLVYALSPSSASEDALKHERKAEDYLVALKVAIPGDSTNPRNSDGEVEYVINTVAQMQWLTEFTDADDEDIDD